MRTSIRLIVPLFSLLLSPLLLAAKPQTDPGFSTLFDGKSLAGWVTRGGRYDGAAVWTVEQGCIVGRQGPGGEGGLLYTERAYASFELRLEVQLDEPFDSGIFLRMLPPESNQKGAQVTLDWRPGGEIGAIYADGFLQHNEPARAHFKKDSWNDLRVRCSGFDLHIEVELNGQKITEFVQPAGTPGFAFGGLIGLQVHGERGDTGAARFRNIRIRQLPMLVSMFESSADPSKTGLVELGSQAKQQGWNALLGSESMDAWSAEGPSDRYQVRGGVLSFQDVGEGGHLLTKEDFQDFCLRVDFRTAKMANSGLFLRAARDGSNPAFSGCEVQILDDFHWEEVTGTKLEPWQFTGGLYGALPPAERGALLPIGDWNSYEVLYRGSRLAVVLNGRLLYDVDTLALSPHSGDPFAKRAATGFIGLQHHGSKGASEEPMVAFRNIFVQRL